MVGTDPERLVTSPTDARRVIQQRLRRWHGLHGRTFPWRSDPQPYRVLVAEILLRQTGAWKAERAFVELMQLAPNPLRLGLLDIDYLSPIIAPLGLVSRAATLLELGRQISSRHGGIVPGNAKDLMALAGVGRYTTNAVLCFGFGRSAPLVDGMTGRFYRRLLGLAGRTDADSDRDLWTRVEQLQPRRPALFHLAIIDLASTVCTPRGPKCGLCPVADICVSRSSSEREPVLNRVSRTRRRMRRTKEGVSEQ